MGLTKDYGLAIVPGLLVVPENKRKFIVFSFRPIVFWTLKMYFDLLLT